MADRSRGISPSKASLSEVVFPLVSYAGGGLVHGLTVGHHRVRDEKVALRVLLAQILQANLDVELPTPSNDAFLHGADGLGGDDH